MFRSNSLFAVFDGHGGSKVASYAHEKYQGILDKFQTEDKEEWLKQSFLKLDSKVKLYSAQGSTANVVYLDHDAQKLYVANVGDSRCLIQYNKKGLLHQITKDHNVKDPEENERIKNAGYEIKKGRIDGLINISRAIGDHMFKQNPKLSPEEQAVTANPDTFTIDLSERKPHYLLIGCDGIFDRFNNAYVGYYISKKIEQGLEPQ